jgi:hypothetical protein
MDTNSEGPAPRCLECGRRATYEREMMVRIQLHALTHEGERERLLSESTPRTIVGHFCPVHAQPFLPRLR